MKFTIRDVLWLTVVVGMGSGWWIDHRRQAFTIADLNWVQVNMLDRHGETVRHEDGHWWILSPKVNAEWEHLTGPRH